MRLDRVTDFSVVELEEDIPQILEPSVVRV